MIEMSDIVTLIDSRPDRRDANGVPVYKEHGRREVFCNPRYVQSADFWKAYHAGAIIQHRLEIYEADYNKERKAEYGGVTFYITRVSSVERRGGYSQRYGKSEYIEIYLSEEDISDG